MEVHSTTADQPSEESHSPFQTWVGSFIGLLTLALPIYITAHYSNVASTVNPAPPPAVQRR